MLGHCPNITGSLNQISLRNSHGVIFGADGAFSAPAEMAGDTATAASATGTVFYNMAFRGSNCSSIYKNNSTVQSNAFQILMIIKV